VHVLCSKYIYPEESAEPEQTELHEESPTTMSKYSDVEPAPHHLVTFTTLPPPQQPPSTDTEIRLEEAAMTATTVRTGDIQWTSAPNDAEITVQEPITGDSEWTSLYVQILSTAGYNFDRQ